MAKAANNHQGDLNTQPFVEGLGDSFHRTVPVSAPRLDSFRMIKVVGKGSFGKSFSFGCYPLICTVIFSSSYPQPSP